MTQPAPVFVCPGCQKNYRWVAQVAGKMLRCACGSDVFCPPQAPGTPVRAATAAPARGQQQAQPPGRRAPSADTIAFNILHEDDDPFADDDGGDGPKASDTLALRAITGDEPASRRDNLEASFVFNTASGGKTAAKAEKSFLDDDDEDHPLPAAAPAKSKAPAPESAAGKPTLSAADMLLEADAAARAKTKASAKPKPTPVRSSGGDETVVLGAITESSPPPAPAAKSSRQDAGETVVLGVQQIDPYTGAQRPPVERPDAPMAAAAPQRKPVRRISLVADGKAAPAPGTAPVAKAMAAAAAKTSPGTAPAAGSLQQRPATAPASAPAATLAPAKARAAVPSLGRQLLCLLATPLLLLRAIPGGGSFVDKFAAARRDILGG